MAEGNEDKVKVKAKEEIAQEEAEAKERAIAKATAKIREIESLELRIPSVVLIAASQQKLYMQAYETLESQGFTPATAADAAHGFALTQHANDPAPTFKRLRMEFRILCPDERLDQSPHDNSVMATPDDYKRKAQLDLEWFDTAMKGVETMKEKLQAEKAKQQKISLGVEDTEASVT